MRMEAASAKRSGSALFMSAEIVDRQIIQKRTFDAPRDLVWAVFTDPKHVDLWWGPNGFRNETHSHAFKVGGEWKFTMHGPDGKAWPNRIVYKEVVAKEKLVYEHGDFEKKHFDVSITFEDAPGGKTLLTMTSIFPSKDAVEAVKKFGAVEGGKQTLARLAGYLANQPNAANDMIVTRLFDAPVQLVWDAWSKKEMIAKWMSPKGFTNPTVEVDFRVGGAYRIVMRDGEGNDHPFHGKYLEIVPNERIQYDAIIEHMKDIKVITTVTFAEEDGKTRVTVRQTKPTEPGMSEGQFQGWSETLEKLAEAIS